MNLIVQPVKSQEFKGRVGYWSDWAAMTGEVLKLERAGRPTVYVIGQAIFDRLAECVSQPAEPEPKETDQ